MKKDLKNGFRPAPHLVEIEVPKLLNYYLDDESR